jgi:hypothetical protein
MMLVGAAAGADKPGAPGVSTPFAVSMLLDVGRVCDGINVLSSCEEAAEDSLAESGFVGCFKAATANMLAFVWL